MTDDRMALAKRRYTRACEAFLRGDADAARRCEHALRELEAAQRAGREMEQQTTDSTRR